MMTENDGNSVRIFNEFYSKFPGGVFVNLHDAEAWIIKHSLSGILTQYPLNTCVYDLFVEEGWFTPKKPEHFSPKWIGSFTQASQAYIYFVDGKRYKNISDEQAALADAKILAEQMARMTKNE